ncbi:hypothetical protein AWW66_18765 [Micromonospora rosaria]|uniref:DUF3137 domain-containing protein n=1 Tax=Micromonospora rosaria TaxID=47874 RepID=A0A136PPN7_9ACTN|nr:hypothetical protein [Micromonospora rosaria]KXK60435.1 hypothetical protein AWW66_18765 [Micromonospora rosaria]
MKATADAGLDTTPLTVASTRAEMREFTTRVLGHRTRWNVWVGLLVLYPVATAAVAALVLVALILGALGTEALAEPLRDHALLLSAGTAACLVAAVFIWVAHGMKGNQEELFRLHRFAAANGFDFAPEVKEPDLPGLIFQRGTLRRCSARLRRFGPRPLEVADYTAWIARGRAGESLRWSYFALTLGQRMPQIVLDARTDEGRLLGSTLPVQPAKDRRTPLGGPFEEAFRLFCPPEAEGWARALFTPDIVARFVGPGKTAFDVEVVEDRLFVYSHLRSLSCCDPQTWRWMSETADALYARLEDLDDNVAMPTPDPVGAESAAAERPVGLAPPYARLRRPFPVMALVPLLVMVGVWAVALAA